jgi:hypothetical protein
MKKFVTWIVSFDLITLLAAGFPVYYYMGAEPFFTVLLSFLITTVLAIVSFLPFLRMKEASMNRYMAAMLAGMFIRMIFIGVAVAVVFVFTEMHQIVFTVALLFSYICKSVIETYVITRQLTGQSTSA